MNSVPLSARHVKEREFPSLQKMCENKCFFSKRVKILLFNNETTDVSSNSQLMVYVSYRLSDATEEEMLFS